MIILDTNVISELMKPRPDRGVVRWVASQPPGSVFTTAICQAEILLGVALLPGGKRRDHLRIVVAAMFAEDFAKRVLPFAGDAARFFAEILAARRGRGRPISHADAQIAAIARAAGARLATRNVADFDGCGVQIVNPWGSK